ncbi:MAG TPA: thiamine phosphate synthase [Pusillimonas sp.]|uniref:thiamine phosphate synthase n=1 Tax=unclassified Pusillimonas TaxID=2640016 RepID=UPI002620DA9F|nr:MULTISPECIES: thiamine phosphate synthase [unclassified Pusillimonas]HLU18807.1 thiamine phosphate synthase [Pusillimonas sp.]
MSKPFVDVAAGLILRSNNELLLAERPGDKPWSGWWELPGGKIEPGETVLEALSRELKEELDIQVTESARWVTHVHEYPKTIVRLSFCKVTGWEGTPTGIEGQRLAWVRTDRPLDVGPLLPATEPPLRWLQLPDRYLITSIGNADNLANFLQRLERALSHGKMLVQFREPQWASRASSTEIKAAFDAVLHACRQAGSPCLVNSIHPESWWHQADGVHFRAQDAIAILNKDRPVPEGILYSAGDDTQGIDRNSREYALTRSATHLAPRRLVGVSAHNADELESARSLGADFAVLGHVLETPSHPDHEPLGWPRFSTLAFEGGLPVYAIGGQSSSTLSTAIQHGAHGIAGIRFLAE